MSSPRRPFLFPVVPSSSSPTNSTAATGLPALSPALANVNAAASNLPPPPAEGLPVGTILETQEVQQHSAFGAPQYPTQPQHGEDFPPTPTEASTTSSVSMTTASSTATPSMATTSTFCEATPQINAGNGSPLPQTHQYHPSGPSPQYMHAGHDGPVTADDLPVEYTEKPGVELVGSRETASPTGIQQPQTAHQPTEPTAASHHLSRKVPSADWVSAAPTSMSAHAPSAGSPPALGSPSVAGAPGQPATPPLGYPSSPNNADSAVGSPTVHTLPPLTPQTPPSGVSQDDILETPTQQRPMVEVEVVEGGTPGTGGSGDGGVEGESGEDLVEWQQSPRKCAPVENQAPSPKTGTAEEAE